MASQVILGIDEQTREKIILSAQARAQHTYVIGVSGVGKTTLLETIALSDIEQGDGLCFLDPHGEVADDLLRHIPEQRAGDVIFWDATDRERPFGLNLFECGDPADASQRDRVAAMFIQTFKRVFPKAFESGAPRMEELLRNMALTFVENPGYTLAETSRFLQDRNYRARFLRNLTNPYLREEFWPTFDLKSYREQDEIIASSLNKLGRFLANTLVRNIFGQPASSLDFLQLMNERKILIVRLPVGALGEENAELLGSIIVGRLLDAVLVRGTSSGLPHFHLIVDEFQRFVSSAFPTLLDEARKYRVDVVVAHQNRDQLYHEDGKLKSSTLNVRNKITFAVNAHDAGELAGEFDITPPPAEMRLEVLTQPALVKYQVDVWTPPEAEAEYHETERALSLCWVNMALMQWLVGVDYVDETRSRFRDYDSVYISDMRRVLKECCEQLGRGQASEELYSLYHWFSPLCFDSPLREYLIKRLAKELKTGPNGGVDVGVLYREGVQEHEVPAEFPSRLEYTLEQAISCHLDAFVKRMQPPYGLPEIAPAEIEAMAREHLSEVKALLVPLRRLQPAYTFVPRYSHDQYYTMVTRPSYPGPRYIYSIWICGDWITKPFPDAVYWFRDRVEFLAKEIKTLEHRKWELEQCRRTEEREKPAGYEVPVPGDLNRSPIGSYSVHDSPSYRKVPGIQKSPNDVKLEIANSLVRLRNHHARCKLIHDGNTAEYLVAICRFAGEGDPRKAQRIIEHSRALYGRDCAEVERAIARRLQFGPGQAEERAQARSHSVGDDDELTFGDKRADGSEEKKAAPKARPRRPGKPAGPKAD